MDDAQRIKEILIEQLQVDEADIDRNISFDSLALDSLEMLQLIVALEEEFDISLDDKALDKLDTLGEMSDYIIDLIEE